MPTLIEDLERIEQGLMAIYKKWEKPDVDAALNRVKEAVEQAHKSFSGSWLGYHSRVYYENLEPPPPGAHFSSEWGLMDRHIIRDTRGEWREFDGDQILKILQNEAGSPSLSRISELAATAVEQSKDLREELLSIIDACLSRNGDQYLEKMKKQAEGSRFRTSDECIEKYRPKGKFMSRDMVAVNQGFVTPPHILVLGQHDAIRSAFNLPYAAAQVAKRVASHLSKMDRAKGFATKQGSKVFIGHGGSAAWRELKDFIQERLGLEADEFNRKPIAGTTNIARLSEMLDDATIAFLVMTAEDEQKDGKMHARMNVIHEAGLFQGRLGFMRAIVVLEESCEEFSNIQGLGQIRFPPKKIKAAFEEIRQVLEREGILEA